MKRTPVISLKKRLKNEMAEILKTKYQHIINNAANYAVKVSGDRSILADDVKQEIVIYILAVSLRTYEQKYEQDPKWFPNVKMMSRNAVVNLLNKINAKRRATNINTLDIEFHDLGSGLSPQRILEILQEYNDVTGTERRILDYLMSTKDNLKVPTVQQISNSLGISYFKTRAAHMSLVARFAAI